MLRRDFAYELPRELIAQYPLPERDAARLLCLDRGSGELKDRNIADLQGLLNKGDLLVLNDTRVLPARILCRRSTGGKAEILLERITGERTCLAQVRSSKAPGLGGQLVLDNGATLRVAGRDGEFFILEAETDAPVIDLFIHSGHVPLPPYIKRTDEALDRERYQTVFARAPGAVAAPTAGLHFTDALLDALRGRGVHIVFVTLHVGAATFKPVRVDDLREHVMHAERYEVSQTLCEQLAETRARGGRVIAVGTTVVRALESAARSGTLAPASGETAIFIYPGFEFRVVDALLTNFHLPESTLLMLACAFAGREPILDAYRHAVAGRYRFFSYGDAMFIS